MTTPTSREDMEKLLIELRSTEFKAWQQYQTMAKEVEALRRRWMDAYNELGRLKWELNK